MLGRPLLRDVDRRILGGRAALAVERDVVLEHPRFRLSHAEQPIGSVRSGSYVPGVTRLRPLSESECYTRLYGDRESTVSVIRESEPERPQGGLLGEQLVRLFEERRWTTARTGSRRSKRRRQRAAP